MKTFKGVLGGLMVVTGIIAGSLAMAQETVPQETVKPPSSGTENQRSLMNAIAFPIAELGDCRSIEDCRAYCDKTDHVDACLAFADDRKLMSKEELSAAKKFKNVGMKGPGGCQGKKACKEFCDDGKNIGVCVAFAEKNGLMSDQKLQESKKVLTAVKKDVKPLGCRGRQDCENYCATAEGMKECINFGTEAGILPVEEQVNAQKVLTAVQNGIIPPCRGEACEASCNKVGSEACRKFAQDAGILSLGRGRVIMLQRMLTAINKGVNPSSCSGAQECQAYCSQDANLEECIKFAETEGGLTSDEAAAARAPKDGPPEGPGGCRGKEACDTFCNEPDNSQVCFDFAKDHGMVSGQDLKKIEDGQRKLKASLNNMPAAIAACLDASLGSNLIEKLKNGSMVPGPTIGEKIKTCFAGFKPKGESGQEPGSSETGKCGDGKCGRMEQADPTLCPQDCGQAGEPGKPNKPNKPPQPGEPNKPPQPGQPAKPTQPTAPTGTGKCGDGVCGRMEQADPKLCPQDCGQAGQPKPSAPPTPPTQPDQPAPSTPPTPPAPPTPPTQPPPPPPTGTGKCGDGICGRMEQADPKLCPQDCGQTGQPAPPPPPPAPPSPPDQP